MSTASNALQEWPSPPFDAEKWGAGPWQDEPGKIQWVDEPTGLDCLMVRNHFGAWCGYVGVAEGHPFFGKDYGQCAASPVCEESWCDHSPGSRISVHGGLTFADFCHEATREKWERWRESMIARQAEAAEYPRGDSAEAWRDLGKYMDDYEGWAEYGRSRFICHIPLPGRPARVWWLGFDCAHSGDYTPGLMSSRSLGFHTGEVYRDREYVEGEVRNLAFQLAEVAR